MKHYRILYKTRAGLRCQADRWASDPASAAIGFEREQTVLSRRVTITNVNPIPPPAIPVRELTPA